ncbi:ABC transporter ATP-binding protein [Acidaminococcus massiliensis]|jgi:ABC-2 type transport system ATP-binding protein|uniref:ABC transporter ATP-binding protein n=1 Tax=Acidaminococcus massiliensis TaxID=1852375 RepID=UPI0023F29C32|nr:ABC transporter ATP-binding protein [Acidaminococcus massiliensis]
MNIIEVHNVSVKYIIGDFKDIGIKEYLIRRFKGQMPITEKWALKNITFNIEKGDLLGIIGSNGSGKSTILKILSGIMPPTEGNIIVRGKIAPLLELGAGFDGDLTVKENVFLRGAMLGYTKKFITERYPEILSFSELEDYEDVAFRRLSSGMKSKLAFSLASLVRPDILILDEVLSVGDIAFRKKSEAKMKELINSGITTILVSHSLEQIRQICTKVLWIEQGKMKGIGDTNTMCKQYEKYMNNK